MTFLTQLTPKKNGNQTCTHYTTVYIPRCALLSCDLSYAMVSEPKWRIQCGFHKWDTPKWMVNHLKMENHLKTDALGVATFPGNLRRMILASCLLSSDLWAKPPAALIGSWKDPQWNRSGMALVVWWKRT